MQTKIKMHQERLFQALAGLRDLRVLGLLVFLVIVLLVSWSGVKAIETNYGLQKQISTLDQQNNVQKLANQNLKLQNDYYKTPQYLELAARKDFGLAAAGETVLVVPKHVALAHTVDLPKQPGITAEAPEDNAKKPAYQRNFTAWLDFLFHRHQPQ
ncbi:MAG TPA: septum formation initiator family protein [Candidatus Saccharimonadales bacterium]|nr:septum formation initiator family protein [Candidatus Saccharimonadales bacterium]